MGTGGAHRREGDIEGRLPRGGALLEACSGLFRREQLSRDGVAAVGGAEPSIERDMDIDAAAGVAAARRAGA